MKNRAISAAAFALLFLASACIDTNGGRTTLGQAIANGITANSFESDVKADQLSAYKKYCPPVATSMNYVSPEKTPPIGRDANSTYRSNQKINGWCRDNHTWYQRALHEQNMKDPEYKAKYELEVELNNTAKAEAAQQAKLAQAEKLRCMADATCCVSECQKIRVPDDSENQARAKNCGILEQGCFRNMQLNHVDGTWTCQTTYRQCIEGIQSHALNAMNSRSSCLNSCPR